MTCLTRSRVLFVRQHRQLGDEGGDGENTKEVVVRISSLEGHPSLLKEVREKKINSREEKEELVETEDVVHLGNISDKVRERDFRFHLDREGFIYFFFKNTRHASLSVPKICGLARGNGNNFRVLPDRLARLSKRFYFEYASACRANHYERIFTRVKKCARSRDDTVILKIYDSY